MKNSITNIILIMKNNITDIILIMKNNVLTIMYPPSRFGRHSRSLDTARKVHIYTHTFMGLMFNVAESFCLFIVLSL